VARSITDRHPRTEPIFEVQFTVCMPDYHAFMPVIRIILGEITAAGGGNRGLGFHRPD
jgi:hypothetical protein